MGQKRSFLLFTALCLTLILIALPGSTRASQGSSGTLPATSQLESRIDSFANRSLARTPLAGMSVAVMRGDSLEVANAYGFANLEKKRPARPANIFRTGSVGKQFTAATLLRLAEQNKISLDDSLGKYLREFPKALQSITVRQLLSHTAGLREINGDPRFEKSQGMGMTFRQVLRLAGEQPLDFKPGADFSYSNTGYLVAAGVIEEVTGRPAPDYITRETLTPLGLRDTSACRPGQRSRWAHGYDLQPDHGWQRAVRLGRFPALAAPRPINLKAISGAGAFCSTPADLVRWTQALHHGEVMSPASLRQMTEGAPLPGGRRAPYGLGTQIRSYGGRTALGHSGTIWGYQAIVAYFPQDDMAVSMMMNTLLPEQFVKALWENLLGAVFDERPTEWKDFGYRATQ